MSDQDPYRWYSVEDLIEKERKLERELSFWERFNMPLDLVRSGAFVPVLKRL